MPLPPARWRRPSESEFPWEREALEFLAEHLPNQEPVRMWSNFEFLSNDGHVNEIDALILTAKGLFHVEIKSRPARRLGGDAYTWSWTDAGRAVEADNPLIPTDRKSKRLASLLAPLERKEGVRLPFIESLVFCSAPGLDISLPANFQTRVFGRDRFHADGSISRPGIIQAVTNPDFGPKSGPRVVDTVQANALARMLDKGGVCRVRSARRVNGYKLETRLAEGAFYADYLATHPALKVTRRIRLYPYPPGASQDLRGTIRRAAEREFRALEHVTHPGLLKPLEFHDTDQGPTLLFEHDATAQRLDHFIRARHGTLSLEARVHLLREIAETVRFAHEQRRIHRALSPQCVLVKNVDAPNPTIQIMNWHLGTHAGDVSTGVPSVLGATDHMSQLVDDVQAVYLAPEANLPQEVTEAADVFSLGAVAYFVLTGQPPATSALDLSEKVRRGGLLLTDVLDAPNQVLVEMVRDATGGTLGSRADLEDVLAGLDLWEESVTAPDELPLNAADASSGDELPGGFRVEKRLGKGATAVALQVRHDNERLVLKVALGPDYNERVRQEGQVLQKLHHPRIVGIREIRDFPPLTGLLIEYAGDRTLGRMLRDEGRLSLEFLERMGSDLLDAVDYLEQQGIWHRDIKPENIGILQTGRANEWRLALFDFSLARTPLDQIRAGTPGYLDPFIPLRQPARYDLQAERFATAVTLYEMATGKLPTWGDGSDPLQLECEATIDTDSMDSAVREGLAKFFQRALARNAAARFDNASDMWSAWRKVFADATVSALPQPAGVALDGLKVFDPTLVGAATLDTPIDQLGISVRGANALERLGVSTLREMLQTPVSQVFAMRGVGNKTRRELKQAFDAYSGRFTGVDLRGASPAESPDDSRASVDTMFARLLTAKDKEPGNQADILGHLLGLDGDALSLPSQTDVAARVGVTRAWVSALMQKPRNRWAKDPAITALRRDVLEAVTAVGGVMGVGELATAIADRRGSVEQDEARLRRAVAVLRSALEAEESLKEPRFSVQRRAGRVLIATSTDAAAYAFALGQKADSLASGDVLLPSLRAVQALREVASPLPDPLDDTRLLRLATTASASAALTPRMEIYPRGMSALRAAKLCGNLAPTVGPDGRSEEFTVDDVRRRVSGRFPEAEPLPDRPELDAVLASAEWSVQWSQTGAGQRWAYVSATRPVFTTSDPTFSRRPTVSSGVPVSTDERALEARRFHERLTASAYHGGFLVLTVPEKAMQRAEAELTRQFGVPAMSLERELLTAMHDAAAGAKVRWDIVLRADAAGRDTRDWQNLTQLVQRALPKVAAAIPKVAPPTLLTYPGLLTRYDQWSWLTDLAQTTGRADGIHGLWLLVPWEDPSVPPVLGDAAVPLLPSQRAHIPEGWLQNRHRAA